MSIKDPLIVPTVTTESRTIPIIETPVVTVSDIPGTVNVGDRVKPKVNVKRADGTTNISGCPVDFFVQDVLGVMVLGERVKTDASGDAEATEYYYVGKADAGLAVDFIIVTRPIIV